MLSDLAGSFSMENMGGAGMAYTQNIRDYAAPELDANDEDSIRARQRWAQSNGYQDEANSLGVKLGELGAASQLKAETDDKNARLANMFGNAIPGLPENLQDIARGMRDGLATGDVSYMEAVEFLQNPQGGTTSGPTGSWYTAQEYANDHNATNNLKPGDDGYLSASEAYNITNKNIYGQDTTVVGNLAAAEAEGTALGGQNVKDSSEALEGFNQLRDTNNLYQQAWTLLDEGKANTGTIDSMLPTIKDASIELQTLGNELGFQIVAGGKFGQLTEKELELALTTGLPKNMSEEGLKQWLTDKMAANNKLKAEYNKFLTWSQNTDSVNKTAAYYQFNEMQDPASPEAPAVTDDSNINSDAEAAAQSAAGSGTTPSGIKYRRVGGVS
jgi:hypothetical protein